MPLNSERLFVETSRIEGEVEVAESGLYEVDGSPESESFITVSVCKEVVLTDENGYTLKLQFSTPDMAVDGPPITFAPTDSDRTETTVRLAAASSLKTKEEDQEEENEPE